MKFFEDAEPLIVDGELYYSLKENQVDLSQLLTNSRDIDKILKAVEVLKQFEIELEELNLIECY